MTTGIEPNRHPATRALVLGPLLPLDFPGTFNAAIQDVSRRSNSWVGTAAARLLLGEKDGLTPQAIYRETDTERDYEWAGPALGWRRYRGGQKLFNWQRAATPDTGKTPLDPRPQFQFIAGGSIPTALAKAGEWEITTAGRWHATAADTIAYAHVTFGNDNTTGDMQYDLKSTRIDSLSSVSRAVLTENATAPVRVELAVQVAQAQVLLYDIGVSLNVRYVGPIS